MDGVVCRPARYGKMIGEGERILAWINARNYHLVRSMAFEAEIDGLKCICSNMPQGRSSFFDTLDGIKDYDVMINFYMNKKRRWNLSFYSAKKRWTFPKLRPVSAAAAIKEPRELPR